MGRRAALGALIVVLVGPAAARADTRPDTVPAVRAFVPAPGPAFALRGDARVVVRHGERRALRGEARTLAADLGGLLGRRVRTVVRGPARTGDVLLTRRTKDGGLGAEGYTLRVGRVLTIAAPQTAGIYYGGRTLLQLLRSRQTIGRGHLRDVPRYRERGLMVDCGRAFYPRAWWLQRIRQLSDLKLNLIHLHLSDDQGFRIAVPSHPEIVSPEHLTKDDVAAMVAEAARRHVTLVPEVDMPGHLTHALGPHPELQLKNVLGQAQAGKLDISLPAARRFAHEIVGDVLTMFPGPWYHAGFDEYLGVASTPLDYDQYPQLQAYAQAKHGPDARGEDAVLDFANEIAAQVRAAGKRLRVWSDGVGGAAVVPLDADVAIEWWEQLHSATPNATVASGRDILNVGWWPLYFVTGGPLHGLRAPEADMYEAWTVKDFEGPYTTHYFTGQPQQRFTLAADEPHQLGATLAVWNDDPTVDAAKPGPLAAAIAPRLAILAQKTWDAPQLTSSYATFRTIVARVTTGTV